MLLNLNANILDPNENPSELNNKFYLIWLNWYLSQKASFATIVKWWLFELTSLICLLCILLILNKHFLILLRKKKKKLQKKKKKKHYVRPAKNAFTSKSLLKRKVFLYHFNRHLCYISTVSWDLKYDLSMIFESS